MDWTFLSDFQYTVFLLKSKPEWDERELKVSSFKFQVSTSRSRIAVGKTDHAVGRPGKEELQDRPQGLPRTLSDRSDRSDRSDNRGKPGMTRDPGKAFSAHPAYAAYPVYRSSRYPGIASGVKGKEKRSCSKKTLDFIF